ncbi:sensor histidine kinase [Magnetococcus sp. PR-3]|uniref:sensor histidine kinase n=1 Tax=Magnetococcus sp. PR-3 TaxID=3120355 RepID=UPI002FCE2828
MKPPLLSLILTALSMMLCAPAISATHGDNTLVIGVLAKRGISKAQQRWITTATYLTQQIPNYQFEIRPLDFNQVFAQTKDANIDFVLTNSAIYVQLEYRYHISRIATLRNRLGDAVYDSFGGVIFTRRDHATIQKVEDLKASRFMAVNKESLGGYLMARRALLDHGIDPHKEFAAINFVGTHDAVVHGVKEGLADAGTVRTDTLERMAEEGEITLDAFRILATKERVSQSHFPFAHSTRLYPEWPMAALPHIDQQLAKQVAIALLKMPQDHPAAQQAAIAGWTIPHNYQSVHSLFRQLQHAPYEKRPITFTEVVSHYSHWLAIIILILTAALLTLWHVRRLNIQLLNTQQNLSDSRDMLEQSAKLREEVEQIARHDIKGPLAAMTGLSESLLEQKDIPSTHHPMLNAINKSAYRALTLVNRSLILVQMEQGMYAPQVEQVDLARIVRSVWRDSRPMTEAKKQTLIQWINDYRADEKTSFLVQMEEALCYTMLGNLMVNAVEAAPIQSAITIRLWREPQSIVIELHNLGTVPTSIHTIFFDKFATAGKKNGLGLGTYSARLMARVHRGDISMQSDNESGTTLTITIPQ